ncbi:MAG: hypothetical protein SVU32_05695 [Candidatus Nanohaloarchaea archaeon]|nr:hypothetical protein [Candidatus Nanohaloarchaea archaeon]
MYRGNSAQMSLNDVEEAMELQVLGTIEYSSDVQYSIMQSQPITSLKPHASVSRSFKQLAADLTARDYSPSIVDRLRGMLQ